MSGADEPQARDRAALTAVLVALFSVVSTATLFLLADREGHLSGFATGSLALAAGVFLCRRVSRRAGSDTPVREFWRLWSIAVGFLLWSSAMSLVCELRGDTGMPVYEAVPTVCCLGAAMLTFRHAPLGRRTSADWSRVLLDGAAVAVAGALFFGYVVVDLAPAGTPLTGTPPAGTPPAPRLRQRLS